MSGALEGIRVLDASTVIAGPFGAALLGDFGADVIKVEMPGKGDSGRNMGPLYEGKSLRWATFSRNKKSITLDLRKEEGKKLFLKLVEKSDIIIENFRTGTFDKWGLDSETLKKANPRIIVIRITGYGQTGPYAHLAGFGTPATAFSGLTYMTGYPDRPPVNPPISLCDYLAGLYGAFAAMVCIYYREVKHGTGQEVDLSLYESIFRMLEGAVANYDIAGKITERRPSISGSASPSGTFKTKDGKWVVLVCSTDRTFEYFAHGIGRSDLLEDSRFNTNGARVKNNALVEEIVIDWMSKHDYQEIKAILDEAGAPVSLVYSMADIFADPHYAARENIIEVDHPDFGTIKMPGIVPKLSATPGEVKWGGPKIGAHNEDIYGSLLGLSPEEVSDLKEKGII
ncbi:CaiB/BaiF CoA transferase family protein [Sporomusa acidovorans]|uniref:Succinyl-CoA--L-malate CoA-transferase beta subunit n=1 Tax=Sporomusa acidovorans (strain ATCC 49682 / DSM 3132 / Mol) TaxID=1123286 RepID=A0ABZ3J5T5_SPOA4|nr:CoA transferase [Sporomusa acidovorans]OZC19690.1 bile acid-CoA hydrolase [Sporomusa acidovorans DSM 3132]SDF72305.1 Crotonobetainyl-CoA:carnitine CoA-transferase CaiB [Sporomusa acidovorans]